jgi:hypothetical protein
MTMIFITRPFFAGLFLFHQVSEDCGKSKKALHVPAAEATVSAGTAPFFPQTLPLRSGQSPKAFLRFPIDSRQSREYLVGGG